MGGDFFLYGRLLKLKYVLGHGKKIDFCIVKINKDL